MLEFLFPKKKRGPVTDRDQLIENARYVVVDTELTGLDFKKDKILSIGAVRMQGGGILAGDTMHILVDPEGDIRREGVLIHGITPSDVRQQPSIDEALYDFFRFIGTDIIVGWCVTIDMNFLNREMNRIVGHGLDNAVVDVQMIHEWLMGRRQSYRAVCGTTGPAGLTDVAASFGIRTSGAHNAEIDAYITAQLFQRQIPMMEKSDIKTIGRLLRVSDPLKGGDSTGQFVGF